MSVWGRRRFRLSYNRVHGVASELRSRAASARAAARVADRQGERYDAAALRGKSIAYREALELLERLERDRRIGRRRRHERATAYAGAAAGIRSALSGQGKAHGIHAMVAQLGPMRDAGPCLSCGADVHPLGSPTCCTTCAHPALPEHEHAWVRALCETDETCIGCGATQPAYDDPTPPIHPTGQGQRQDAGAEEERHE